MSGALYTPMRIEQRACRGAVPETRICGRGTDARVQRGRPTVIAGVAGGLDPRVRPGDVIVAEEVRCGDVSTACPSAPLLASALRRAGLTVHVGPVETTSRVVDGAARAKVAAGGALAVDTESGYVAPQVPPGLLSVVRVIVDTPSAPLVHPGTVPRGIKALRHLASTAPVLRQWLDVMSDRTAVLAAPRSFCAGVERAIETVERALARHGPPVYVRRQIVHNAHVVERLEAEGAVFVQELDEVPKGAVTVLAAHGVTPQVHEQASARDLRVVDATCPLVSKVHHEVQRYAAHGNTIFLIGHGDHEEVVGTRGEAPGRVIVIENEQQAEEVTVEDPDHVAYVMQTTLAVSEADKSAQVLRRRFPALVAPRREDICYATTNRQNAIREIASDSDLVLVVGSDNSSNSKRLVEVARSCGVPAHLVEDASAVRLEWLRGARRIGVSAGASAPQELVDDLLGSIASLGHLTVTESTVTQEDVRFSLPREVS